MLIQTLWKAGLGWDDKVSTELEDEWRKYRENLKVIEQLRLYRWIYYSESVKAVEIHGFSDASEIAYAAVIYICTISNSGERKVSLLT